MMLPLRIAFLIAPWCFVWLIAIGCSRQDTASSTATGGDSIQVDGRAIAQPRIARAASDVSDYPGRYAEIVGAGKDPVALRAALTEFYEAWGESAGEEAVDHALVQHRSLLRYAFAGWAHLDPAAPRRWVLSQSVDSRRQQWLAAGLLRSIAVTDHRARGHWLGNFALDPEFDDLLREVAMAWASEAPGEALDWLEGLPDSRVKSAMIDTVFRRWSEKDPGKAGTRLAQMRPGAEKDHGIICLAKALDRNDPEAAQLWVESIADENLRKIGSSLLSGAAPTAAAPRRDLLSRAE